MLRSPVLTVTVRRSGSTAVSARSPGPNSEAMSGTSPVRSERIAVRDPVRDAVRASGTRSRPARSIDSTNRPGPQPIMSSSADRFENKSHTSSGTPAIRQPRNRPDRPSSASIPYPSSTAR